MNAPLDIHVVNQFSSKKWRLANLYYIENDAGERVKFQPNEAQQHFFDNLWYLNVNCKSRQLGFCLDPATRVLTADLRWVPIGEMTPGQEIISVDEHSGGHSARRKMRTGKVEAVVRVRRPAYRITFEDGRSLICTGKHPWLSRKSGPEGMWRSIEPPDSKNNKRCKEKLTVGSKIRWITKPWGEPTFEDGWFGGMLDGEGSMANINSSQKACVCQLRGPVFDRIEKYVKDRGYNYTIESDLTSRPSKFGKKPCPKINIGRMDELFRLIGQTRPTRFLGKRWWEGRELPGKKTGIGWLTIAAIDFLGDRDLVDLQTSVGTYIAEGFVSHNTTGWCIYMLDECLFYPNQTAIVIAHTIDSAKKIFRDKIDYPYQNLPAELKGALPADNDTAQELVFVHPSEDGSVMKSSISVDSSGRSGTFQYMLISEFGKICAKWPEKADEIMTGSLNTVAPGNYVTVESTAEGTEGHFYEMCKRAHALGMEVNLGRKQYTQMDFKFHFYGWYWKPTNALSDADTLQVTIDEAMQKYFLKLETEDNIYLTPNQKAWYVKKKETQGELMLREHPSTWKEAFQSSIEGKYFSEQFTKIRKEGRICKVPHQEGVGVDTYWDLGMDDYMTIWFVQDIGREVHVIDYYANSDTGFKHYFDKLAAYRTERGYFYRHHVGPHDLHVREMGAGDGVGQSRVLTARKLGYEFTVAPKFEVADQVEAARNLLSICWFDEARCNTDVKEKNGISCLENFAKVWSERRQQYTEEYVHNWASHASSAFMTMAMMRGRIGQGKPQKLTVQARSARGWT